MILSQTGKTSRWFSMLFTPPHSAAVDYSVDTARGNTDATPLSIQAKTSDTQLTLTDIWGGDGDMVWPAFGVGETLEIVSTSANDAAAGTGARTGLYFSLDTDFNEVVTPFTLNGTTPVTLGAGHHRRQSVRVITGGSSEKNEGKITVQVAGAGAVRAVIDIGRSRNFDGQFTIPAGKFAVPLYAHTMLNKNYDGFRAFEFRNAAVADSVWSGNALVPLYQNIVSFEVRAAGMVPEKTDINGKVMTSSTGGTCVTIVEFFLYDM